MTPRKLILAAVLLLAAPTAAFADAIDGDWCSTDGMRMSIRAKKITTPGGKVIMVDPWILGNPTTPAQFKNLDALGKLDLILVTHAHGDHLGDAVALAKKNNVPVWAPGPHTSRSWS